MPLAALLETQQARGRATHGLALIEKTEDAGAGGDAAGAGQAIDPPKICRASGPEHRRIICTKLR